MHQGGVTLSGVLRDWNLIDSEQPIRDYAQYDQCQGVMSTLSNLWGLRRFFPTLGERYIASIVMLTTRRKDLVPYVSNTSPFVLISYKR